MIEEYPEPSWIGEVPNEPLPEEIKCCPACGNHFIREEGFEVDGKVICSNLCTVANEIIYQQVCKEWVRNNELQSQMKLLFEKS